MKQSQAYTIDLTKIDGTGDFPCPRCGIKISPEDETEKVYHILKTKLKNDSLEELVILCHKCGSRIHIVGFIAQ